MYIWSCRILPAGLHLSTELIYRSQQAFIYMIALGSTGKTFTCLVFISTQRICIENLVIKDCPFFPGFRNVDFLAQLRRESLTRNRDITKSGLYDTLSLAQSTQKSKCLAPQALQLSSFQILDAMNHHKTAFFFPCPSFLPPSFPSTLPICSHLSNVLPHPPHTLALICFQRGEKGLEGHLKHHFQKTFTSRSDYLSQPIEHSAC